MTNEQAAREDFRRLMAYVNPEPIPAKLAEPVPTLRILPELLGVSTFDIVDGLQRLMNEACTQAAIEYYAKGFREGALPGADGLEPRQSGAR